MLGTPSAFKLKIVKAVMQISKKKIEKKNHYLHTRNSHWIVPFNLTKKWINIKKSVIELFGKNDTFSSYFLYAFGISEIKKFNIVIL